MALKKLPISEAASLHNTEYAKWLSENGREHIKHNFLITHHLEEYLRLSLSLYYPQDIIYL